MTDIKALIERAERAVGDLERNRATFTARYEELHAENAALKARIAELEAAADKRERPA